MNNHPTYNLLFAIYWYVIYFTLFINLDKYVLVTSYPSVSLFCMWKSTSYAEWLISLFMSASKGPPVHDCIVKVYDQGFINVNIIAVECISMTSKYIVKAQWKWILLHRKLINYSLFLSFLCWFSSPYHLERFSSHFFPSYQGDIYWKYFQVRQALTMHLI